MTHSPLPWKVEYSKRNQDEVIGIYSEDECIVETDSGFYNPKKTDAEFIVKAVNMHDELVWACKKAISLANQMGYDILEERLEAVLAKAEE